MERTIKDYFEIRKDFTGVIPADCSKSIFGYLRARELTPMMCVSKRWYGLILDVSLPFRELILLSPSVKDDPTYDVNMIFDYKEYYRPEYILREYNLLPKLLRMPSYGKHLRSLVCNTEACLDILCKIDSLPDGVTSVELCFNDLSTDEEEKMFAACLSKGWIARVTTLELCWISETVLNALTASKLSKEIVLRLSLHSSRHERLATRFTRMEKVSVGALEGLRRATNVCKHLREVNISGLCPWEGLREEMDLSVPTVTALTIEYTMTEDYASRWNRILPKVFPSLRCLKLTIASPVAIVFGSLLSSLSKLKDLASLAIDANGPPMDEDLDDGICRLHEVPKLRNLSHLWIRLSDHHVMDVPLAFLLTHCLPSDRLYIGAYKPYYPSLAVLDILHQASVGKIVLDFMELNSTDFSVYSACLKKVLPKFTSPIFLNLDNQWTAMHHAPVPEDSDIPPIVGLRGDDSPPSKRRRTLK